MTANSHQSPKRYRYLLMVSTPEGVKRKVMVTPRPLENEDDLVNIEKTSPSFKPEWVIVAYTLMAVGTNDGNNVYHYKPKL